VKVQVMTGAMRLRDVADFARRCADAGFAGVVVTEAGRTAYLTCAAAALCDAGLDIATGVAVAFPRSPMVTAATAWELADVAAGRFRLGIGPQVKAHVERRYSAPFDPPGPRMREYVLALRAILRAFRGEDRLAFDGRFYSFSLLPPLWSPGPLDVADPPIDIAAVNPWMLRMAGEVADGVHVHPLNTVPYYRETLLPNLADGARRSGRNLPSMTLFVPLFTVVGDTESEMTRWREACRTMVAFYGSTPNYAFIFEQLGYPGTTQRLRDAQRAGDQAAMAHAIPDELLAHFVVEGTWAELPQRIIDRCSPLRAYDVRPVLYLAGMAAQQRDGSLERFGEVARTLASAP
jgi:probable F420-dependent oxidoreductase